jgi:predicted outer membrane repeat protein
MRNPSCSGPITWTGGRFSNNTAADGGALYLTELTTRIINGSALYENNRVSRDVSGRTCRGL